MNSPKRESEVNSGTRVRTEIDPAEAQAAESRLSPGTVVGNKYVVKGEIGTGGYAKVYEAEHRGIGRRVAIKVVHSHLEQKEDILLRFEREAKIAARIRDRHVAEIYDVGYLEDGAPYIVMELLEGKSLDALLAHGSLPLAGVVELGKQLLRAVSAAHRAEVIHRDIKPQNIMLHEEDSGDVLVKLLDFGISKRAVPDISERALTSEGIVVGSPDYMSPEQLRGRPDVDYRTDVYSVGVVLYQATTGRPPFDATNLSDLTASILRDPVALPSQIRGDCPVELDSILIKAIHRDADGRYQTADEMASELYAFARAEKLDTHVSWDMAPSGASQVDIPTEHFGRPDYEDEETSAPSAAPQAPTGPLSIPSADSTGPYEPPLPVTPASKRSGSAGKWLAILLLLGGGVATWLFAFGGMKTLQPEAEPVVTPEVVAEEDPELAEDLALLDEPLPPAVPFDDEPLPPELAELEQSSLEDNLEGTEELEEEPVAIVQRRRVPRVRPRSPQTTAMAQEPPQPTAEELAATEASRTRATDLSAQATAEYLRGHLPAALTLYRRAAQRDPGYAPAWRGLGLAATRMGQPQLAIQAFTRYLNLRPNASDVPAIQERLRRLGAPVPGDEIPANEPPTAAEPEAEAAPEAAARP